MSDTVPEPTREQWNAVHQACIDTGIPDLSLKVDAAMVKLLAEREAAAEQRGAEREHDATIRYLNEQEMMSCIIEAIDAATTDNLRKR